LTKKVQFTLSGLSKSGCHTLLNNIHSKQNFSCTHLVQLLSVTKKHIVQTELCNINGRWF